MLVVGGKSETMTGVDDLMIDVTLKDRDAELVEAVARRMPNLNYGEVAHLLILLGAAQVLTGSGLAL